METVFDQRTMPEPHRFRARTRSGGVEDDAIVVGGRAFARWKRFGPADKSLVIAAEHYDRPQTRTARGNLRERRGEILAAEGLSREQRLDRGVRQQEFELRRFRPGAERHRHGT